jgi:pantothenate synthetase
MAEVEVARAGAVVSTAVRFGATRLIDNIVLAP